jgi:hypothetical protein
MTWDQQEQSALATYGGGYQTNEERKIFHHGISTVYNCLRAHMPQPEQILELIDLVRDLRTSNLELRGQCIVNKIKVSADVFALAFNLDDQAQKLLAELGRPTNEEGAP